MSDTSLEVVTFHELNGGDLHYRFIGEVRSRAFIVNLQMSTLDSNGSRLQSEDYGSAIREVLTRISASELGEGR